MHLQDIVQALALPSTGQVCIEMVELDFDLEGSQFVLDPNSEVEHEMQWVELGLMSCFEKSDLRSQRHSTAG